MYDFPEPPRRTRLRYRVHGVVASMILHSGLVTGLFVVSFVPWWYDAWAAREARAIRIGYSNEPEKPQDAAEESPPVRIVSDPADVTGQMIKKRLAEVVDESEAKSDEENLERLDQLSDRLTRVSSEASIDAMASAFGALMGTDKRAERPAEEPVAGKFDLDTAQFHDIKRYPKEGGGWRYVAVLLDAEGRTYEVEMTEEEAEAAYQTLERIKRNPLLSGVYRQMAMPLFDQLLGGLSGVADAAKQLEESAEESESTDSQSGNLQEPLKETDDPFGDSAAVEEVPPAVETVP
jgi:hypothetical protein